MTTATILQMIFSGIFILWLFAVLVLLWRHALGGSTRTQKLQNALVDSTLTSANAAETAAEAAKTLADILEKKHAP